MDSWRIESFFYSEVAVRGQHVPSVFANSTSYFPDAYFFRALGNGYWKFTSFGDYIEHDKKES